MRDVRISSSKSQHFLKHAKARASKAKTLKKRLDEAGKAILDDLFPEQRAFVLDPYRRKSLLCPRRAGKTHVAIAYACYIASTNADVRVPIITLTLRSAKYLYWTPLREFNQKYGLGIEFKVGSNEAIFPNGSKIRLHGADSLSDIERLRGGAYKLAIVDECKSIRDGIFRELIDEVLGPATNDVTGTIAITGTPGRFLEGAFYEATYPGLVDEDGFMFARDAYNPEPFWKDPPLFDGEPMLPQWTRHHWTVQQNVFKPEIWANAVETKRQKKWSDDNPIWVRESLGKWVSTSDTMVYALSQLIVDDGGIDNCRALWFRNYKDGNKWGLPITNGDDWEFIVGMDLGFNDDFAVVVMAYSPTHQTLNQVYEYKAQHLIVPQMAAKVKQVVDAFDNRIVAMVADTGGLGKLVVETLNQQYGFFIEAAEKSEKFDHIELFNSDLHEGRLKVLTGSDLYKEMTRLQWDFRGLSRRKAIRVGKIREDQAADNHLCDAALYTWRFAYHHYGREPEAGPEIYSQAWYELIEEQEVILAEKERGQLYDPQADLEQFGDMLAINQLLN